MSDDLLHKLEFFQGLTEKQLAILRPFFSPCNCEADVLLFEQTAPAEYLYIVVTGEFVIRYKPEDGSLITVGDVGPGGVVGWSAALGSRCYTSGAMANVDSRLLRVRGADLRRICHTHADIGEILSERLVVASTQRMSNIQPKVVALLSLTLRAALRPQEIIKNG